MIDFKNLNLKNAVKDLHSDTLPQWGTMNAQQMLEHLSLSMHMSSGKMFPPLISPVDKLAVLKRVLISPRPLPRNFNSGILTPEHKKIRNSGIEDALNELQREINDFHLYFISRPGAKLQHPVFGDLDYEEWMMFHSKHFTHHFEQFGLLNKPNAN